MYSIIKFRSRGGALGADTDNKTNVNVTVPNYTYTLSIPSTTVLNADGTSTQLSGNLRVKGGNLSATKQLVVTASTDSGWTLKVDGGTKTIKYGLYANSDDIETTTTWTFTAAETNKSTDSAKYIYGALSVVDAMNATAGTYSDSIIFTAEVTNVTYPLMTDDRTQTIQIIYEGFNTWADINNNENASYYNHFQDLSGYGVSRMSYSFDGGHTYYMIWNEETDRAVVPEDAFQLTGRYYLKKSDVTF